MKIRRIENMVGNWFIGNFDPTIFKTSEFEVCYKLHKKNELYPVHYHKIATEINYLIRGRMIIQGMNLFPGDIFVLHPHEIADPVFLEDCELIVIKVPSIVGDKYELNS